MTSSSETEPAPEAARKADRERQMRMCRLFGVATVMGVVLVFIAATADCIRVGSFDPMRAALWQLVFLGVLLGMVMSPFFVFAALTKQTALAAAAIYGPVTIAIIVVYLTTGRAMGGHVAVGVVYLLACMLVDRFLPEARED